MRHLASYVAAIRQRRSPMCIESMTRDALSWQEDGFKVTQETVTYRFTDGATIFCTTEQDSVPVDVDICPECWITYEVVSDGHSDERITPARMTFNSTCREAFWLKCHAPSSDDLPVSASAPWSAETHCHDADPMKENL